MGVIHNRVAVFRADLGMSRQELADQLGINYQTVGFIERGNYSPSLELAFAIAKIFRAHITDVFSDEPFKPLAERK